MDLALQQIVEELVRFRRELRAFSKLLQPLPTSLTGADAAMVSLYLGLASLSSSAVLSCTDGEIYAARALTRAVAEHWMRFMSFAGGTAPADFFGDLEKAEAIQIDRRLRTCFPEGQIPNGIPGPILVAIKAALIDPPPTNADRKHARDVEQGFNFADLCRGMLAALKAHDGQDDAAGLVMMAFSYARFSACVHGGPLARDYLVAAPSAYVVAATASDILSAWTSALSLLLAKLRGRDDPEARAALSLQVAFVRWATGPRGPLGGLTRT